MRARSFLILVLLLLMSVVVEAGTISVSPEKLDIEVSSGHAERQLTIYNGNDEPLKFRISVDYFPEWFSFDSSEGVIPAHSLERVKVTVAPSADSGAYSAHFTVQASNGNEPVQLGAVIGVRIIMDEAQENVGFKGFVVSGAVVVVGFLGYLGAKDMIAVSKN